MTNYCEALREVSSSKGEIPSRKGFPGYLYSDLATLFERAGCLRGARGHADAAVDPDHAGRRHRPPDSRPDRLHHRRPDRALARPRPARHLPAGERAAEPVAADEGRHRRPLHRTPTIPALASQLYAAYARAAQARVLASVVGDEGLADTDRRYLRVRHRVRADAGQPDRRRARSSRAWRIGWRLLAGLPRSELTRLSDAQIAAHIEGLS